MNKLPLLILSVTQFSFSNLKIAKESYVEKDTTKVNFLIKSAEKLIYKDIDKSLKVTNEALQLSNEINWTEGIASCYRQIGVIYQNNGNLVEATNYFYKALNAAKDIKSDRFNASIYNNLGSIYVDLGETEKAIDNYNKLLNYSKKNRLLLEQSIALLNIGFAYQRAEKDDLALEYLNKSIDFARQNDFLQVLSYAYNNKAVILNRMKLYNQAIEMYSKSVDLATKVNDVMKEAESTGGIGETYFYLKQYDEALLYTLKGISLAEKSQSLVFQKEMALLASDIYDSIKNYKKSLVYYKKYVALRDSILDNDKKSQIEKKELEYQFEKREALVKEEIKREKLIKKVIIVSIIILVLSASLIFYFYSKKKKIEQINKELDYLRKVSEIETKAFRLQMNPHFVFNSLNSINELVLQNRTQEADHYITKFAKLLRSIIENSEHKEITIEEDIEALKNYMQLEAFRLNNKFTYNFEIDDSIDLANTLIPPMLFQPFVENSIWHGIAPKEGNGIITVAIIKEGNYLECCVEDNGIGIKVEKNKTNTNKKSLGMAITKSRIDFVNDLNKSTENLIVEELSEGLRIVFKIPLHNKY